MVQTALKQEPNSARILAAYASLLSAQGRTSEAELLYRQILNRYPDSVVVLNNLAWLLAVQNQRLTEALELINSAIKNGGPLATFLDTRALVLIKMGKYDAAIAELNQAMKEEPSPTVRLHLAQAMLLSGDDAGAMKAIRTAKEEGLSLQSLHRLEQPNYRTVATRLNLTL
jgi:Tfp pilus assembly protein PilF